MVRRQKQARQARRKIVQQSGGQKGAVQKGSGKIKTGTKWRKTTENSNNGPYFNSN